MLNISPAYRIEDKSRELTLEIIRNIGFDLALEEAYSKALYLVANSPTSTVATEWLAWSHNLLEDSRKAGPPEEIRDLLTLSSFYRKLAHKVYWYLKKNRQISDMPDFIRLV